MKFPNHVITFAGGLDKMKPYKQFHDYYNHWRAIEKQENATEDYNHEVSFSEKEEQMSAALKREILRIAQVGNIDDLPLEMWATHPTLKWATFAVVSAMIDMVLPDAIISSVGMFSEVRNIGWGDSAAFDVEPRDIFVVSKAGRSKRIGELHKQFRGQITILPEPRQLTVFVSLMKVLAGKESLAPLVSKMVRSFETQLSYDIYEAFKVAMDAVDNTASTGLRTAGWSQSEFLRLSQIVGSWNGGVRPVAIGTVSALGNILPTNANYRYELDSPYVRLGYIQNFLGVDLMAIPQVADWETPFGLKLDNDRIWIISPSSDKIVKVVLEGSTLAHTDDIWRNANLVQTSTMYKSWGTGIATNAIAALITIT